MAKKKIEKVEIYSTPSCVYCNMAKEYFKENNVKYNEYNVLSDMTKRREMMEKSGQMGVPVITIGKDVIVGFDQEAIANALGV
ncbi:glutathione S-transferase N-terminal domain-containing protein [Candidatus Parcubacteria bacterium]|nr:glutathione S-transferase N-terminal domain-containing protein [Candidatus Parcubacteria bacterium]